VESTTSGTATASCYQSARNVQPVRDYRPENLQKRLVNTEMTNFHASLAGGYATADCQVTDGLLLAVSGGADSIALLHGTLALWPDAAQQLVVAHVNHRLRGADSDADADFVAKLAKSVGLRCELLTVEQGSVQANSRGSVEEAARNVRYDWLAATAKRLNLASVVTAHHMDDQAETILHHIIRGTGLRGLGGMRSSRPLGEGVSLVRPMLAISQTEIDAVIATGRYEYREDVSNQEFQFTRNRLRAQLLPLLAQEFNPQVTRALVSLGQQAAASAQCLDELADQLLDKVILEAGPEICQLDADQMTQTGDGLLRHAFTQLWIRQQWPRQKMTSAHWQRLCTIVQTPSAASFQMPGPVDVRRSGNLVRLSFEIGDTKKARHKTCAEP